MHRRLGLAPWTIVPAPLHPSLKHSQQFGLSVSRVGSTAQFPAMKQVAGTLKLELAPAPTHTPSPTPTPITQNRSACRCHASAARPSSRQ